MMQETKEQPARAIAAAVQLSSVSDAEFEASLTELRQLARTLGFEVVATFTQNRAKFDSAAYFGLGKREELRLLREKESADIVLIDQRGKLEKIQVGRKSKDLIALLAGRFPNKVGVFKAADYCRCGVIRNV